MSGAAAVYIGYQNTGLVASRTLKWQDGATVQLWGIRTEQEDVRQKAAWRGLLLTKCRLRDQMKENEMGGARGTCGGAQKCRQNFGGKRQEMNHLEDTALHRRIILKCT